ncbi:MAG: DNA adenine methylase [wastewater metagenome]|nr:DNA adenine methylase [Candidatus Loosdrechtia aerotolerans]
MQRRTTGGKKMQLTRVSGVKSPIYRFGGKHYLASWIAEKIPGHAVYVEPFAGAGHLLFAKGHSKVEVLNDIDKHLMTFYNVLQHPIKRRKLVERLQGMPYSRSLWQEMREQWKQGYLPSDEVIRSAWWFYLNRTCFAGDQLRGGFAVPSTTGRNPVQSFRNAIDSLNAVADRLRNVCIENLDYRECINRYDSRDTLFFCDPPYLNAEHYYTRGDFTLDDHSTLADLLHQVKGKVMITHYQNDLYDELYRDWQRYKFQSFKGSHKADTGEVKPQTTEALYCNFEPRAKTRDLFERLN